jgi:hypothetical protein
VTEVLALGARSANVEAAPANRLSVLARYGLTAKAPALRDLAGPRQTADRRWRAALFCFIVCRPLSS